MRSLMRSLHYPASAISSSIRVFGLEKTSMRKFSVKHATKETLAHLEAFMASPDFKRGVIQATEYELTGGCNIELLEDGTWSIVPMIGVGNLYESPGVFLPLPILEGDYIDDGGEIATD